MQTNETRIRYLEVIQSIIKRLSNTSFILKGWAVSLVSALMALSTNDTDKRYVMIAYLPIAVFWFLDAYFLMMERQFRKLFQKNSDLTIPLENFSINREKGTFSDFAKAFFSITIVLTYASLIFVTLIVMFYLGGLNNGA